MTVEDLTVYNKSLEKDSDDPVMVHHRSDSLGERQTQQYRDDEDTLLDKNEPILTDKPKKFIEDAKAAFKKGDVENATNLFADALQLMNTDNADPFRGFLAPIYYAYGMALYQLSVKRGNFICDDTVPMSAMEDSSSRDIDSSKKVIKFEDDYIDGHETEEDEDISHPNPAQVVSIPNDAKDNHQDFEPEFHEDGDIDSCDDLQLAFEVLDMSRLIYINLIKAKTSADEKNKLKSKLSDVHVALADVAMEIENFDGAFEEYEQAANLKTEIGPKYVNEESGNYERVVAELYYKMSMALEFSSKSTTRAIQCIKLALEFLKRRENDLKEMVRSQKGDVISGQKELEDLASLFPDLESKIEELSKPSNGASAQAVATNIGSASCSKKKEEAMNDLTLLVKKKEKRAEDQTHIKGGEEGKEEENLTKPPLKKLKDTDV